MSIAPVKRCASLAKRHSLSLHILPDDGLLTPGDASPGAFIFKPAHYRCPASLACC
ncbi:hypothetical protein HF650_10945 [Kosakonia sp. SMBL-WEM22]|uniref:hypothetical protein n=1 Tax=Kosakonia sp. SMBL-WEM22 TaxID=2725560 RepID=UPI001659DCA7|nr:hypothetical protein [Kosakonia sp. SMBL-WEM22]QNQ20239.1 hypothetical protein HF650_10945 [Kosakonia sp. SMBL-WEM22]